MPDVFVLVLQIIVVIAAARMMAAIFKWMHQPQVVGEMFAGILLGPSLLGWIFPQVSSYLFPASSLGHLNALSQIGLVVFMFLVGVGINPNELKGQGRSALLISHVSIAVPFVSAALLGLYLYPRLSDSSVGFTGFALFLGAAMSMTAFPVLARILTERKMLQSRLGTIAIAAAAMGDVTGWCVLAYIVVLVRAQNNATPFWMTLAGVVAFAGIMIYGVRRLLGGFEATWRRRGALSENQLALILVMAMLAALCTERLGIHLLFGAFLMGAIMPKQRGFVRYVLNRFETITVTLLLPLFFASTGLRTSVGLIHGSEMWMYCGLIILVAIAGKLGGTSLAARLGGLPWRESAGLGVLMNTRGLMELVILNIGLDIKVISPALFSMMVVMALVTTAMTTPMLDFVCPIGSMKPASEAPAKQGLAPQMDLKATGGYAA